MLDEEYEQLEKLLSKLKGELKENFLIIPEYIHGGYHIQTFNSNGDKSRGSIDFSIKSCVERMLNVNKG